MHSPTPWMVTWSIPKYNTLYTCTDVELSSTKTIYMRYYIWKHTRMHAHTHRHTLTQTERNVCTCAHPHAPTPPHTHTHACMHAHTHTHCSRNWVLFGVEIQMTGLNMPMWCPTCIHLIHANAILVYMKQGWFGKRPVETQPGHISMAALNNMQEWYIFHCDI